MKLSLGEAIEGPAGTATRIIPIGAPDRPDWTATVSQWFLTCPGQSPAWEHYMLGVIHLRPIEGARAAVVDVPGATHEVLLYAMDPKGRPDPLDNETWTPLFPLNVTEQVQLDNDEQARDLARQCAVAVVNGVLPAEPPLAGAVEPWRTALVKTTAHYRGEEHAP